jgi:hypothetical protein
MRSGAVVLAAVGALFLSGGVVAQDWAVQFHVEGMPVPDAGIQRITVEDLVIDEREMSTGADWDFRTLLPSMEQAVKEGWRIYAPGDVHYGSITVRARVGKSSPALYQWWQQASRGKNIRKNISVVALKRDGSAAREWKWHDCFPTRLRAVEGTLPNGNGLPRQDVVVVMDLTYGGLSMRSTAPSDEDGPVAIVIDQAGSGSDPDSAWETCSGGGIAAPDTSHFSGDVLARFHTPSPGHKFIDTLTLRGPVTGGRKALCQWITEVVQGRDWRRGVTVKEILKDGGAGKQFTYLDCFPTRYVFPVFSAQGAADLYEEVHIKPIRLDIA